MPTIGGHTDGVGTLAHDFAGLGSPPRSRAAGTPVDVTHATAAPAQRVVVAQPVQRAPAARDQLLRGAAELLSGSRPLGEAGTSAAPPRAERRSIPPAERYRDRRDLVEARERHAAQGRELCKRFNKPQSRCTMENHALRQLLAASSLPQEVFNAATSESLAALERRKKGIPGSYVPPPPRA